MVCTFVIPTPLIQGQLGVVIALLSIDMVVLRFLSYADFVAAVTGGNSPMCNILENSVDAVVGGADLTVDYL